METNLAFVLIDFFQPAGEDIENVARCSAETMLCIFADVVF